MRKDVIAYIILALAAITAAMINQNFVILIPLLSAYTAGVLLGVAYKEKRGEK